ncbi:MAG: type II secretion system F family protein [Xanthomonadaceae bacterium]|nr:type II secretion system F family protein [Xanthomonadaceae bacterium]
MSAFEYKAINDDGKIVFGRIDAANDSDLETRLMRMGLEMIRCKPASRRDWSLGRSKVGRRELIAFCFHLEQLTRAGVPIMEGLADLRDSIDNPRFREVVAGLIEDIEGGKTLSEALERFPAIFSKVFYSLVRAGEQSGMLPDVLRNITESLKWQDELAAHTKKIVMYPAFVATVVLGVLFFMMIYLVPQLTSFIMSVGQELPIHTRALIVVSNFIINYWFMILLTPPALFFGIRHLARVNSQVRYRVDGIKLRIWPIGPIYAKILLSRFASNFALMFGSGITVLDSLRISEQLVDNKVIEEALQRVYRQISEGVGLTSSFENTGLFPPLVIRMLRVGENTGALDTALANVSYFYNRDVRESIERVQALIEPALTVVLGLLLGWVMLSVLGPIYDILGKIT